MSQEIKPQQNSFEKEDKQRKALAFLLILLLSAGGVFYYIKSPKNDAPEKTKIEKIQSTSEKKPVPVIKQELKANRQEKEVKSASNTVKLIKQADRSKLVKLAMAHAGRVDPFSESAPKMEATISIDGRSSTSIQMVPVKGGDLPAPPGLKIPFMDDFMKGFVDAMGKTFKNLPGFPGDFKKLFSEQPVNFEIKGFIGDKVIVNVDGNDEAIGKNESYQGIKAIKVDPGSLKAVFKVNNHTVTKTMKSLTDISERDDIKLVNFK